MFFCLKNNLMSVQLKRAQELIKFCKEKLTKTDEEIKKILAEK